MASHMLGPQSLVLGLAVKERCSNIHLLKQIFKLISACRAKEAWDRRGSEMKAELKRRKEELKSSSKVHTLLFHPSAFLTYKSPNSRESLHTSTFFRMQHIHMSF